MKKENPEQLTLRARDKDQIPLLLRGTETDGVRNTDLTLLDVLRYRGWD